VTGWGREGAALVAALAAALAGCAPSTTPTAPAFSAVPVVSSAAAAPLTIGDGAIDTWNGWLPDGRTFSPFDATMSPVARLDPLLLKAIQDAARAAQAQGVDIALTSGWRSKGFQQRLFDDAVRQYRSVGVAQQFVASPDASKHVIGEAVDITGTGASEWLIRNGAQFGLCQIYANENWHFELAVDQDGRCPPLRPNAAG